MGKRKRKGRNHSIEPKRLWIQALNNAFKHGGGPINGSKHEAICDLTILVSRAELPEKLCMPTVAKSETLCNDDRKSILVKRCNNHFSIHLHKSAMSPIMDSAREWVKNFKPLPYGDCGDGIVNPYGNKEVLNKYWAQRHKLFSKFDKGIQLDAESWYSVTPESIAQHIARRVKNLMESVDLIILDKTSTSEVSDFREPKGCVVVDAFCGCGGNTIAFAMNENTAVISIDHDRNKLYKAAANCAIYEIPPNRVIFIEGDVGDVLSHYKDGAKVPLNTELSFPLTKTETYLGYTIGNFDCLPQSIDSIFLSPPWGGPSYCEKDSFTLTDIVIESDRRKTKNKYNGVNLLSASLTASKLIMVFLPRNIDGEALGNDAFSVGYRGQIELEQQILEGKLKTVTAYFSTSHKKSNGKM